MSDTDFNPEEFGGYDPELMPKEDYKTSDPPTYKCTVPVICPGCGKNHGDCDVITNRLEESDKENEDNMIQRPPTSQPSSNGGGQQQQGNFRKRNGLPFLNVRDISFHPEPATIVVARVDDDNFKPGNQIVNCKIKFRGQHFLYGLRFNNPNLGILCDAFGQDERDWVNKEIEVSKEADEVTGREYIRFAPSSATARGDQEEDEQEQPRAPRKPRARA